MTLNEDLLSDWLEDSVAYGAFENDKLIGMVEGFLEKWNNRFRIANICAFDQANRKSEIGTKLMETILKAAEKSGARMVVLETQTINFKAISFYKKTRI
ncbi:MAG: GNAT family N-acetyltransferase [Treponema sp.]|nr:GNAT family N-acetyltransferase [Treponema sp.]